MDASEAFAETYLKALGFDDVRYEPDGNVPPDFLVDGRIAVEVRRLNQNFDDGSGARPRGLEETAIPLWRRMQDYLIGLGPAPASGPSWFVFYRFSRPTPPWKALKRDLDAVLLPFMAAEDPQPFSTAIGPDGCFTIRVFRAARPKPTFFRPAGHSDEQSGGWLIGEMAENLKHCIAEKTAKIALYRTRYPEWRLVLADHIGFGLDAFEQDLFLDQVTVDPGGFDRIVLLDPRDASRAFQVYP